jgi:hypothetical protein
MNVKTSLIKSSPSLFTVDYQFVPWRQPKNGKGLVHLVSGITEEFVKSWKDSNGEEQVTFYKDRWVMEHRAMFYISSNPMTTEEAFDESFEDKGRFITLKDSKPMFLAELRYAQGVLESLTPQEQAMLKHCSYYTDIDRNHAEYISENGMINYLLNA